LLITLNCAGCRMAEIESSDDSDDERVNRRPPPKYGAESKSGGGGGGATRDQLVSPAVGPSTTTTRNSFGAGSSTVNGRVGVSAAPSVAAPKMVASTAPAYKMSKEEVNARGSNCRKYLLMRSCCLVPGKYCCVRYTK
jgi:hypothetical protein